MAERNRVNPQSAMIEKAIVVFKPSGRVIEVEVGTLLSDAAVKAGLDLDMPCGGQGRCGRCQVQIEYGEVARQPNVHLSSADVEKGYALACQTVIKGNVVAVVPTREEAVRQITVEAKAEKIALPVVCDWQSRPAIQKCFVQMEPPSLADNTNDVDRLKRALNLQYGIPDVIVELPVLKGLARTLREADWAVTAVLEGQSWGLPDWPPRLIGVLPGDHTATSYGVAVDIGTTTVTIYLTDLLTAEVMDIAAAYNAQISCGEDVISRIVYSQKGDGLQHLQRLVIKTINELLAELAARNRIDLQEINEMVVAGNTTMIHLFLGLDPLYIRVEPYIPTINLPPPVRASELGIPINPHATIDCMPGVGAYVGGDISAGVLSSRLFQTDKLTLFIDVGTNGEIVLGNNDWLICCACSAGPAFEGAGVRYGMRATAGAIEDVWINPQSYEVRYQTIGNAPPRGICGSGMISLLAEMFITGVVDKRGKIRRDLPTPRVRVGRHGSEFVIAWADETGIEQDIVLSEVDVENLIRTKAAIYAGFSVLVRSVGINLADVEEMLIGGSFGRYINIEKAIQIGLLPDMPWDRFRYLGNTSALGAYTALLCPDMRRQVIEIAKKMTYLELSADNRFYEEFMSAMFLPHTDEASFPSVRRALQATRD